MALILILSVYDVIRASEVRCVRPADERRVYTVGEMDALPGDVMFTLGATPATVPAGRLLKLQGTAAETASHRPAAAVVAILDEARVIPAIYDRTLERFTVAIAPTRGRHEVRFKVISSDLTGFYVPNVTVSLLAR